MCVLVEPDLGVNSVLINFTFNLSFMLEHFQSRNIVVFGDGSV